MKTNKYTELVEKYRNEAAAAKKNATLSDQDLANAVGGVGGPNEATCPKCGKPMRKVGEEFGDGYWECDSCGENQLVSDAEFIEIVRYMEQNGMANQIEYPVWWNQVNH